MATEVAEKDFADLTHGVTTVTSASTGKPERVVPYGSTIHVINVAQPSNHAILNSLLSTHMHWHPSNQRDQASF